MEDVIVPAADVAEFLAKFNLKLEEVTEIVTTKKAPVWDVSINSKDIPLEHTFVANGFVTHNSTDAEYLANILKSNRIDANVEDVFGIRDPKTGKWLVKPRVRYYSETVAEKFFDYLAKLERLLPDVRKIGDDWFYIYENTKPNKSIVGSKYDKSYFSKTGKFRVPAPNGNLQALVICDSYPAMLPEKMDTDDPSNAMAMQARMFSEQMKRVKGRMKAKRIAVIGINQLRQKPAVMFGCFHGSSKVVMADGSTKAIRDLVLTRSREKVLSYNQKTGAVEARRIKDWFQNGTTDSWLQFKARGVSTGNGLSQFRCTPNHLLLGADGVMRPAAEYRVGDKLMANSYQPSLTADQKQVILGSIIGDGWFGKSGTFHIAHAESQLPYLEWKHSLLRNVCPSDICQGSGYVRKSGAEVKMYNFGTVQIKDRWFAEQFKEHRGEIEGFGYHLATMAKKIDLLGIAVWLMDDGSKNWFTKMCSVSPLELRSFVNTLNRRFKLGLKVGYIGADHGVNISAQTVQVLSRYLHPQFRDSLALAFPGVNLRNLGKYKPAKMATGSFGAPAEIWSIEQTANMTGKDTAGRSIHDRVKYDIEVEGNHTYCVNGIFVHNSPEYEPGGEALKFYCFAEDTTLVTSQGLLTAKEYLEEGNGTILGVSGEEKPAMYDTMGFSQLVELKTQFGNVIKGKPGHRVFTVKHNGFGTHWRKLSAFTGTTDYYVAMKVGADLWAQESPNFDFTSVNRFDNSTVEVTLPENGSVELAYVLGYLTAEGCLSENGRVIFTMADVEVMEHYYECFSDVFGVPVEVLRSKTRNVEGTLTCDFFSTEVYNFLRYLGGGTHSRDKKVPKCIRTGTREEVQAFLSAFYEGDGSINSKSVSCFSTSYELASGIQQLLFNFGVISSLIERQGKYHSQKNLNRIWHVITNGKNSANLLKVIAFISERKAQSQSDFAGGNHKHDVLSGDLLPPVSTGSAKLDAKIKEIVFPKSKYLRASLVAASKIDVLRSWVSTLRTSHERTKNENLLNKFVAFVKNTETNGIVWAKVAKVSSAVEAGMTYDANMPDTHTIVTNGIVSHNSDCRIRLASRALSAVVNGGKGYEETEDSYNGEGEDTYRYVHARAIKNKLSVPNLECFLRIWITDADGAAMGIDPVFDTFQYLEMTGQISGPRKKMVLKLRKHDEVTLDWGQLKTLVLGSRKEVAKVCDKIGLEKMFIREFCRKQLNKGVGIDLFFENKKNAKLASKAKNKAAESDDDEDDDDED